jgi:hypothetical protein
MMKMRLSRLRLGWAWLAALAMLVPAAPNVIADTSSQTSVTFEIVNEGQLDISWASEVPAFTVNGEAPVLTATSPPTEAFAEFRLVISDTRADGNRTGYAVTVQSSAFTASGSMTVIQPDQLRVSGITADPTGTHLDTIAGVALNQPVTILTVENGAPAVNATVTITVAMLIAPGMAAASYSGSLWFDLLPVSSGL